MWLFSALITKSYDKEKKKDNQCLKPKTFDSTVYSLFQIQAEQQVVSHKPLLFYYTSEKKS